MNQEIRPYDDLEQLHAAAADAFCRLAIKVCTTQAKMTVSLSGGSTPKRLYELLAKQSLPWTQIHWFWGDERNVTHQHPDSNYAMVRGALLDHVPVPPQNIHPVPVDLAAPADAAKRYEQTLREALGGDLPRWDLVLLGMGDDAHTASLFPHTEAIDDNDSWFVANWVPKFDAYRYTLTAPAIQSAAEIWFLIAGAGKQQAMRHVLGKSRDPHAYPAQLIRPTRWFVTADAMAGSADDPDAS